MVEDELDTVKLLNSKTPQLQSVKLLDGCTEQTRLMLMDG